MAYKPPKQTIVDNDLNYVPSNEAVFEALKLKLDEPTVSGTNGQLLQLTGYVGGEATTSWVNPPSTGANTSLSNLTAPTALNQVLLGTLGAVGAPAYSFTGDTNTGMWSSGADTLNLSTGGSERIRIDSSGIVGIGTNSPQARLNVSGGWPQFRIDGSGNEAGLVLYNSNVWTGGMYTDVSGANVRVIAATGRDLRLLAGSSTGDNGEVMRCTSSGRVGIGTVTPAVKLDIVGDLQASGNATLNGGLLTLNSANGVLMNNSGFKGALQFVTDNMRLSAGTGVGIRFTTDSSNGEVNERMRIDSSGNVGIGISNPGQRLTVVSSGLPMSIRNTSASGYSAMAVFDSGSNEVAGFGYANASAGLSLLAGRAYYYSLAKDLIFTSDYNSASNSFILRSNGNFGIGTATPNSKLEVNGTALINGNTTIQGSWTGGFGLAQFKATSGALAGFSFASSNLTRLFCFSDENNSVVNFATSGAYGIAFITDTITGSSPVRMQITATGNVGIGTASPTNRLHVQQTTAATNTVTNVLLVDSQSSGTPAVGIGVGIEMAAETAAGNTEVGVVLEAVTTDVTAASEDFDFVVKTMANGAVAAERMRVKSDGSVNASEFRVPNYRLDPHTHNEGTETGNFTINWANGAVHSVTLNAAGPLVITMNNPVNGGAYALRIIQGATPGTVTWPASVKWPGGTPPTLSTTTGDVDIVNFLYYSDTGFYYGTFAGDFS